VPPGWAGGNAAFPESQVSSFAPIALQAKALAASSLMCGVLGLLAVGGWKLAGLQYKEIAEVSSWQDAMALAQQQRVS
jgi:hypothetical protein